MPTSCHARGSRAAVAAAAWAAAVALGARRGDAQAVRVVVRDQVSTAPVPQAVVSLQPVAGANGPGAVAGVTGPGGVRTLAGPPGRYRVEVRRIGQRPFVGPEVLLAAGVTADVEVRVPRQPVVLAGVDVRGQSSCGSPSAERLVGLWEAARTALLASAEPRPGLVSSAWRTVRTVDGGGVARGERRDSVPADTVGRFGFTSLPPDVAEREGFVQGSVARGALFYGLDARILLSEAFARSHCFSAARGAGDARGWVGVRFAPAPRRAVPDVAGVVWLDSATAEPRRVEFEYVWSELPRDARGVGGGAEFERAPSGEWLVRRWRLRTPTFVRRAGAWRTVAYTETAVEAVVADAGVDAGAVAGPVAARSGPPTPAAAAPTTLRVTGTVYDSLVGAPLAGATVTRAGAPGLAITDAAGRFALDDVPAAAGAFVVAHAALDSVGLGDVPLPVDLSSARDTTVQLALPSRATLLARACPAAPRGAAGFAFGTVRDARSGAALPGLLTRVTWTAVDPTARPLRARQERRDAATDADGRWVVCDLPLGEPLEARPVAADGGEGGRAAFALSPRGLARVDLLVDADSAAAPAGVVVGVVQDTAGAPQSGALVTVDAAPGRQTRTGADGRFRVDSLPLGTTTVVVRAVGGAPQAVPVALRPGQPVEVMVTLRRVATLAGVVVRARAPRATGVLEQIAARRRLGFVQLVDTVLMQRSGQLRTALSSLAFVDVVTTRGSGADWWVQFTRRGRPCKARVFVDGVESDWGVAQDLSPAAVLAAEVYRDPATIPAQYGGTSMTTECGAVLLWTRTTG